MRYRSFTRMLCRPARSPLSSSSRLPAGTAKSSKRPAASSSFSLRCTIRHSSCGIRRAEREFRSRNRSAVVSSPKDRITMPSHATRVLCNCQSWLALRHSGEPGDHACEHCLYRRARELDGALIQSRRGSDRKRLKHLRRRTARGCYGSVKASSAWRTSSMGRDAGPSGAAPERTQAHQPARRLPNDFSRN